MLSCLKRNKKPVGTSKDLRGALAAAGLSQGAAVRPQCRREHAPQTQTMFLVPSKFIRPGAGAGSAHVIRHTIKFRCSRYYQPFLCFCPGISELPQLAAFFCPHHCAGKGCFCHPFSLPPHSAWQPLHCPVRCAGTKTSPFTRRQYNVILSRSFWLDLYLITADDSPSPFVRRHRKQISSSLLRVSPYVKRKTTQRSHYSPR